jgi:hypothetical protein
MVLAIKASRREVLEAISTLNAVIARAQRDARRVSRTRPELAGALNKFIREQKPDLRQLHNWRAELSTMADRFGALARAEARFARSPDADAARHVAAIYIVDWDRPELVDPKIAANLPPNVRRPLALACSDPAKLDGDQADMLARWYVQLARTTDATQRRGAMLIRARFYRELADARGHVAAEAKLTDILEQLAAVGIARSDQLAMADTLEHRMTYRYKAGPPRDAVAHVDDDPAVDPPIDPRPVDPPPEPIDAAAPPEPEPIDPAPEPVDPAPAVEDRPVDPPDADADSDSDRRFGGRRMTTCEVCGRQFFAGWGVEKTRCPRCNSGRRNIFDLTGENSAKK